jgi:membrane fusion protein (multidrug efflux system)
MDDAFVHATKESVNARVTGQMVEIAIKDNQRVERGQLLFQVDLEPYRIAVDQAEARLSSARLQVSKLKATFRQQPADLQSAHDTADFDPHDGKLEACGRRPSERIGIINGSHRRDDELRLRP